MTIQNVCISQSTAGDSFGLSTLHDVMGFNEKFREFTSPSIQIGYDIFFHFHETKPFWFALFLTTTLIKDDKMQFSP